MKLILGSRSIGRHNVLENAGYKFETMYADIDEKKIRSEDYVRLPLMIAWEKSKALIPQIKDEAVLITSDQIVVHEGKLREKPESKNQAKEYLKSYPGKSRTITSVIVTNLKNGKQADGIDIAEVTFKKIPEKVIDQLIEEGKILKAAGGFIIENPLISPFVEKVEGEITSVTGLPLGLTKKLLKEVGFKK